jgi:uncharacterized membrane protein (Fun14 family)
MASEVLLSNIIPFAGSGLLGYAIGFALKKVLKWMLIIVGFLAGMFFVGVQLLQRYSYVSAVNWDKLGNDTSVQIQHWGSNATNRILDVLEEKRPKIICIDELDKMPRQFQDKLLNFMESGHIKVDQMRKQYDFKIKGAKVFAACNEIIRLSRPLQSRFRRLHLPRYSEEEFLEVSVKVLPKLKIAHVIGKEVWRQRGDIRDVISIGKLVLKKLSRYLVR